MVTAFDVQDSVVVGNQMSNKPTAYVETTVISYLTSWPSRELVRAAQQQQTRDWWDTRRDGFELVYSELVQREASPETRSRRRIGSRFSRRCACLRRLWKRESWRRN